MGDDGGALSGEIYPAVEQLPGANEDAHAGRGHAVAVNIQLGDGALAQEGENAALAIRLELARIKATRIDILTMLDIRHPMFWLIGIVALAALWVMARGHFSAEARARRRRERSNRPVISRKRGPTVRLAVNVDKPKRERKD
jgi:hypothetical protein